MFKFYIMSFKYLPIVNILISGCLTLLAFSCDISESPADFGTPYARVIINGKVTSAETGEAIKNIRVVMKKDSVLTDKDGTYEVVEQGPFPVDQTYTIHFKDIDIGVNGSFTDKDTIVEFKNPEFFYGDGHWYKGQTTKEIDIKLIVK